MGLLLDLEDDISSLDARRLITLTSELDLGTTLNTLVDVDVEDLAINNSLLSAALLATVLVLDDFTLTTAIRADGLETLDHGTHLAHHRLHTLAITASALLDSTLLATDTGALGANDGSLQGEFGHLATVDVLERHLVSVVNGASFGGAAAVHTTAAEHTAHAAHTSST